MADTTRLVGKMDEAIRALKPQRRQGVMEGIRFAEDLKARFSTGRHFDVVIRGIVHPVRCERVRISRTTVDLGLVDADGTIPLTRVTHCEHGHDDKGDPIVGYGVHETDDSITPIALP